MSGLEPTSVATLGGKTPPKYMRVRDQLHDEIRSGKLADGQPLPAETKLMEALGISRHTVRQALAELENDGFIERIQGRGTFVTTVQQRHAMKQLDTFALIAPELREGMYPSLVHGFESAGASFHHQVVVSNSGNDIGRQADLTLQMIDRRVGGVAMVPVTTSVTPAYHITQLQQHHIPIVFCHRSVEGAKAPCVTWSAPEVGRKAASLLREHGHRQVAFLSSHKYIMSDEFEQGLRDVMNRGSASADNVRTFFYRRPQPGAPDAIRKALEEVFANQPRPTAIFCGNLPDAEQIYLQADAFGLRIPEDLSLIYFGSAWRDHGLAERISCVAVDEREVGVRAGTLLNEMRKGIRPLDSDERIEFPVTFHFGETLGPAVEE